MRRSYAAALRALGRPAQADAEASAARATLEALGAHRDAGRLAGSAADDRLDLLTPRELDVLRLVARGMSDAEIAGELVVSPHTVHRHVANARAKLGLPSRAAAVAYAARAGLL